MRRFHISLFGVRTVPQQLELAAAVAYVSVFAAIVAYGRPGLGLSQGFYLAIVCVGLAGGAASGALGGVLAATLYATARTWSGATPSAAAVGVHLSSYVVAGAVVGYFSSRGRRLLGESLQLLEGLLVVARDARQTHGSRPAGLAAAIGAAAGLGPPFGLLVVDWASAGDTCAGGLDERAVRVAVAELGSCDVAAVGHGQVGVVLAVETSAAARAAAAQVERRLAAGVAGPAALVGWAFSPLDGDDPLCLYRSASERLHARRLDRAGQLDDARTGELEAAV